MLDHDKQRDIRECCGAQAVGTLQTLADLGYLDALPESKERVYKLVADYDAACKPAAKEAA